jgi:hypothetical protein
MLQSYIGLNDLSNDGSIVLMFKNFFKRNENNEYTEEDSNGLVIKIKKQ